MKRVYGLAVAFLMVLVVSANTSCNLRAKIRANEQRSAAANVRIWYDARKWEECAASADRAQAIRDLAPEIAAETTGLKARCLMKLGRKVEALAHYRLLRDFLDGSGRYGSVPSGVASRLEQEPSLEDTIAASYNESLLTVELTGGRYTKAAKWSGVAGSATVKWTITRGGEVRNIRVLTDSHPLLAGLAIEAAAAASVDLEKINVDLLPSTRRTQFNFGNAGE